MSLLCYLSTASQLQPSCVWPCKSGIVRPKSPCPSGCRASKYLELQEVWEQVGATSVLSIPIPAVRNYESASVVEPPAAVEKRAPESVPEPAPESAAEPAPEPVPEPASHVLHNSNGAIGIVTVGLATEKIDLNGRCAPKCVQCMVLGGIPACRRSISKFYMSYQCLRYAISECTFNLQRVSACVDRQNRAWAKPLFTFLISFFLYCYACKLSEAHVLSTLYAFDAMLIRCDTWLAGKARLSKQWLTA